MLAATVFLAFAAAPLGLLARRAPRPATGWALALIPLGIFVLLCLQLPAVTSGNVLTERYPWVPSLGLNIDLTLDGLSLLFGLIISGIGVLIVIYTGYYLAGDPGMGRFLVYLLLFMGAMIGLVLAGGVLTMFVFWELTSVTSYLLVGYKHDYPEARRGAQHALLVTGGGGLALLVGLLLLAEAAKLAGVPADAAYTFAAINAAGEGIQATALYVPAILLVFMGCFTKSAQLPFHFWLPGAMQAPTPASAFLHSATMVKAGIYLLARLYPGMHGAPVWDVTLTLVGGSTLVFASFVALRQTDIKALLAYSTVSMLGTLTMLAGLGGKYAQEALVVNVLGHALYKSALFMIAGIIDHETGTRDLRRLGGLRQAMPRTMWLTAFALLSLSGIPIFFGFVAKELLLEAGLQSPLGSLGLVAVGAVVFSATCYIIGAWRLFANVFLGSPESPAGTAAHDDEHVEGHGGKAHDPSFGMMLAPGIPALLSLVLPLGLLGAVSALMVPAASSVAGYPLEFELALWHGINPALGLSMLAIALGVGLSRFEGRIAALPDYFAKIKGDLLMDRLIDGALNLATQTTRSFLDGRMRSYILYTAIAFGLIVGIPFLRFGLSDLPPVAWDVRPYEAIAALMIPIAVAAAVFARSRLGAIIMVGVVGAMVSFFFVLYSAPDLALTQLLIEVLSTVFLLLVFSVLPRRFETLSSVWVRRRDGLIAGIFGLLMTGLTYATATSTAFLPISPYFLDNSLPAGQGANVVNVILVDFRGFDTMGEITVLFIAVLGIYGMLRLRERNQDVLRERRFRDRPLQPPDPEPIAIGNWPGSGVAPVEPAEAAAKTDS